VQTGGIGLIEEMEESVGSVLGFRFIGEVTDEDYTGIFIPALYDAIEKYGTIRLLVDISDIQSEDIGAMDDDVREDARVVYIEREAIIGDEGWEKRLAIVDHFFLFPNTDVRFFRTERRREAWRWICEDLR
jgi:hypothetical protein